MPYLNFTSTILLNIHLAADSSFDVVNIELLLKRLVIIGLPSDVTDLIGIWLSQRQFYVSLYGSNSFVYESNVGTVQGSVLGPILYSLFVSPLLDLVKITLFADDNYVITWNKHRGNLISEMQTKLKTITDWLKASGLKVNEVKTELCLFHRRDQPSVQLMVNDQVITSKNSMNVLGVEFDCKLNWQTHIDNAIL